MLPGMIGGFSFTGGGSGSIGPSNFTSTADGPSPFQSFLLGGVHTATGSFAMTKLHTKAGNSGFGADVRLCVYAVSAGGVGGALLGYVTITGGFSALDEKFGTLGSPIAITAGNKYALVAQMSASGGFLATSGVSSVQFNLAETYGGSPPPSFAGYTPDGTTRATLVWGTAS